MTYQISKQIKSVFFVVQYNNRSLHELEIVKFTQKKKKIMRHQPL